MDEAEIRLVQRLKLIEDGVREFWMDRYLEALLWRAIGEETKCRQRVKYMLDRLDVIDFEGSMATPEPPRPGWLTRLNWWLNRRA